MRAQAIQVLAVQEENEDGSVTTSLFQPDGNFIVSFTQGGVPTETPDDE